MNCRLLPVRSTTHINTYCMSIMQSPKCPTVLQETQYGPLILTNKIATPQEQTYLASMVVEWGQWGMTLNLYIAEIAFFMITYGAVKCKQYIEK